MLFIIVTLGCKVNQAESGGMEELLRAAGHRSALPGETPDLVVVNTCTVTAAADRKSRAQIRRLGRLYPGAVLGVCGCLAQTEPLSFPGVTLIGGNGDKGGFIRRMEQAALSAAANSGLASGETKDSTVPFSPPAFPDSFETLPDAPPEGRTRLFLKIQDGCENRCAYCRVPDARGPCRSRSPEDVLDAVGRAGAAGIPELVLCGVEIASYQPSLALLTEQVCRAAPEMRVRLGSLYPTLPEEDFCLRLAALPNLCPHFHISLQSGCDATLGRMGRRYGTEEIESLFARLRRCWDQPAISCDILCGFPGETEEERARTLSLLTKLRPSRLHVFPYSRRAGTPAASFPAQVPEGQKQAGAAALRALDRELRREYAALWQGTSQEVLFEDCRDGIWQGHTTRYVPVQYRSDADLRARVLCLRLDHPLSGGGLWCRKP